MNTKNKRVSHPKHLKREIYLRFIKELKAQLDADSTVSTSKIAERFNCSKQVVTVLKELNIIVKIGIGQHRWIGAFPSIEVVNAIESKLKRYQIDLRMRKANGTFQVKERKIQPIELGGGLLNTGTPKCETAMEFDFDAPDIGKRETLLERQMRKSTKVIELDENAMKAWEQKMKEQKVEKSDVPFVAPTDSSMVSEFINHDEIDEQRPDKHIHLTQYEKFMALSLICLAVTMVFSICYITYLFSKNF